MKMADIDVDHDRMNTQPDTGKTIPFTPRGVIEGGSTWDCETSFGGKTQSTRLKEVWVE